MIRCLPGHRMKDRQRCWRRHPQNDPDAVVRSQYVVTCTHSSYPKEKSAQDQFNFSFSRMTRILEHRYVTMPRL